MAIVLARASMSPIVYEVLDFACGICDAAGDLIAQTNGITLFTGTFSAQVRLRPRALRRRDGPGRHVPDQRSVRGRHAFL